MANAVTLLLGADSRPMEAEFAKSEIIAKRFGKTLADVNAADNERMLRNSAALKALNAERQAARKELERYNQTLQTMGTTSAADARSKQFAAEDEAWLRQNLQIKNRVKEIAVQRAAAIENDIEAKASYARLQIAKKEAAEKAALLKAQQIATLTDIARGNGAGMTGMGHGGYGKVGFAGVFSEMVVILREISMGRGTGRILGSVSLLAQRLGLLGKLVKSTASEQIKAAMADTAASQAAATHAVALEAKAKASYDAMVAEELDGGASMKLAEADAAAAAAATANALAQEAKAAKSVEAAEIANASATVSLGPLGWIAIALIAVVAGAFLMAKAFKRAADEARNLADLTSGTTLTFQDERNAMREAANEAEEYHKWLVKLKEAHNDLLDSSTEAVDKLKEEAGAHAKLSEAVRNAQLAQLELDKRSGKISEVDYINKKAQLEKDAIKQKYDEETKNLQAISKQRTDDYSKAVKESETAQKTAETAQKAMESPEYLKKREEHEAAKRRLEETEHAMTVAQENVNAHKGDLIAPWDNDTPQTIDLGNGKKIRASVNQLKDAIENNTINEKNSRAALQPEQDAVEKARDEADKAKKTKDSLYKDANKAGDAALVALKNNSALAAAETAKVEAERQMAILGSSSQHGYALNSQQKVGAYATTPPDFKRLVDASVRTAQNTEHLKPAPLTAPGSKKPQFGTHPKH